MYYIIIWHIRAIPTYRVYRLYDILACHEIVMLLIGNDIIIQVVGIPFHNILKMCREVIWSQQQESEASQYQILMHGHAEATTKPAHSTTVEANQLSVSPRLHHGKASDQCKLITKV